VLAGHRRGMNETSHGNSAPQSGTHQNQPYQNQPYQNQPYQNQTHQNQPPYRRLRRSRSERMLAGVCGGVAEYLRVDPTLVRVGFAVLAIITWGVALVGYAAAWLIMPEE
jgi:phage shock protein C